MFISRTTSIQEIYSSDSLHQLQSDEESTEAPIGPKPDKLPLLPLLQRDSIQNLPILPFSESDVQKVSLIDRGTYYLIPSEVQKLPLHFVIDIQ